MMQHGQGTQIIGISSKIRIKNDPGLRDCAERQEAGKHQGYTS
jgi:hypothetical protein